MAKSVRSALRSNKQAPAVMKDFRRAYVESLHEETLSWCKRRLPQRFTRGNAGRFGWPPLDPKYASRKIMEHGLQPMLVASGRLKAFIISGYRIIVDRLNMRVKVQFPNAPDYATYVNDGSFLGAMGPRPFLEMTAQEKVEFEAGVNRRLRSKLGRMKSNQP